MAASLAAAATAIPRSLVPSTPNQQQPVAFQFQPFHLQILQSLQQPLSTNSYGDNSDDKEEHVTMDATMWNRMHGFLRERDDLAQQLQQANFLHEIQHEAQRFGKRSPPGEGQNNDKELSTPASKRARIGPPTSNHSKYSYTSPLRLSQQQQQQVPFGLKCFGLVQKLLQQKTRACQESARQKSSPYQPLLRHVERLADQLQQRLQHENHKIASQQRQVMEDCLSRATLLQEDQEDVDEDDDSIQVCPKPPRHSTHGQAHLARLTTQLQLWNMLAADLRQLLVLSTKTTA